MKPATAQRIIAALSRPRLTTAAVLLGTALMLPSLWTGFQSDDHIQHVRMGGERDRVAGFEAAPLDLFTFGPGTPRSARPCWTMAPSRGGSPRTSS